MAAIRQRLVHPVNQPSDPMNLSAVQLHPRTPACLTRRDMYAANQAPDRSIADPDTRTDREHDAASPSYLAGPVLLLFSLFAPRATCPAPPGDVPPGGHELLTPWGRPGLLAAGGDHAWPRAPIQFAWKVSIQCRACRHACLCSTPHARCAGRLAAQQLHRPPGSSFRPRARSQPRRSHRGAHMHVDMTRHVFSPTPHDIFFLAHPSIPDSCSHYYSLSLRIIIIKQSGTVQHASTD